MARLVFGMNQTLDGYVDHAAFRPGPRLFRHFIDQTRALAGSLYGRRMYEVMRYWDDERPDWDDAEREFAEAWRRQPKWVASRSLASVGPNARLIDGDLADAARRLKADLDGDIDVAGTQVARHLAAQGLVDEIRIYLHPVVRGSGTPFFAAPPPPLRLASAEPMGEDVVRLAYVPA